MSIIIKLLDDDKDFPTRMQSKMLLAARTCYKSHEKATEESDARLLKGIIARKHLSILEHASVSFHISGISRACSHQIVRHRLSTFSQESQRYVNVIENKEQPAFDYVTPPAIIHAGEESIELYNKFHKNCAKIYNDLIAQGIKKEDARFILPNSTCTALEWTANIREWLHVIDLRVSMGAQWEVEELLTVIWKELYTLFPDIFNMDYFDESNKSDYGYKLSVFSSRVQ